MVWDLKYENLAKAHGDRLRMGLIGEQAMGKGWMAIVHRCKGSDNLISPYSTFGEFCNTKTKTRLMLMMNDSSCYRPSECYYASVPFTSVLISTLLGHSPTIFYPSRKLGRWYRRKITYFTREGEPRAVPRSWRVYRC
jgi:hypothetical protein